MCTLFASKYMDSKKMFYDSHDSYLSSSPSGANKHMNSKGSAFSKALNRIILIHQMTTSIP